MNISHSLLTIEKIQLEVAGQESVPGFQIGGLVKRIPYHLLVMDDHISHRHKHHEPKKRRDSPRLPPVLSCLPAQITLIHQLVIVGTEEH